MKILPITITVTDINQLEALRYALEVNIDIANDTLTDDFPYNAGDIRRMATMSDEGINATLKDLHDSFNLRLNRLEGLQNLLGQLNKADVISIETE